MPLYWEEMAATLDYAFQPIVNVHSGICIGVESLLRNVEKVGFSSIGELFDTA